MVSHDFQIRTLFSTCKLKPLDFVSFNPEQMKATIPYAEALFNKHKITPQDLSALNEKQISALALLNMSQKFHIVTPQELLILPTETIKDLVHFPYDATQLSNFISNPLTSQEVTTYCLGQIKAVQDSEAE